MSKSIRQRCSEAKRWGYSLLAVFIGIINLQRIYAQPSPQVKAKPRLYLVGYSHLDTQWQWTYADSIALHLKKTLDDNFKLFESYPSYQFNFTGAFRYALMKEYWPSEYQRLKAYIKADRWHPAGSSWEENDTLTTAPESILRQILYGNSWFEKEFGKPSLDYMLPDSFGFPGSLPTLVAHAGLLGFSTQKLTWGYPRKIPFSVGTWTGADGSRIFAALDPGEYVGRISETPQNNQEWQKRIQDKADQDIPPFDFRYYGTGDIGGAPAEADVKILSESLAQNLSEPFAIEAGRSDQLFRDLNSLREQGDSSIAKLPDFKGEFLLSEHSAGTLTSNAAMKKWNRKIEDNLLAAEQWASLASWLTGHSYPAAKLDRAWQRLLATHMHDILPGTSIPEAYNASFNDQALAWNMSEAVRTESLSGLSRLVNTSLDGREGQVLLLANHLATMRRDPVEADLSASFKLPVDPESLELLNPEDKEQPFQVLENSSNRLRILFHAELKPFELAVFRLQKRLAPNRREAFPSELKADARGLESDLYALRLDASGDVVGIVEKKSGRQLLSAPIRYQFLDELPRTYPSWNMTWNDRKRPPRGILEGPAAIKVLEQGPLRVAVQIERKAGPSRFVQTIRLNQGHPAIEWQSTIDWATANSSLKVAFPLDVNPELASFDMGLGVAARPVNSKAYFEVPLHKWMDLSNERRGISILSESKYGADRPNAQTLRLTLLFSPHTPKGVYEYGATQDFGLQHAAWAMLPHSGDWRKAESSWQAERFNQALRAYLVKTPQLREAPRRLNAINVDHPALDLKVIKQSLDHPGVWIVRVFEKHGLGEVKGFLQLPVAIVGATEVDGQEHKIRPAVISERGLELRVPAFGVKTYALELGIARSSEKRSEAIKFQANGKIFSRDDETVGQATLPREQYPDLIKDGGIAFHVLPSEEGGHDSLLCRGQTLQLPKGKFRRLHILALSKRSKSSAIMLDQRRVEWPIDRGFGLLEPKPWDKSQPWARVPHPLESGRRLPNIAWFASHTHSEKGPIPYSFNYMFHYIFDLDGANSLTLPDDPDISVIAMQVSASEDLTSLDAPH